MEPAAEYPDAPAPDGAMPSANMLLTTKVSFYLNDLEHVLVIPHPAGLQYMSVLWPVVSSFSLSTVYLEAACSYDEPIVMHPFAFRVHTHEHGKITWLCSSDCHPATLRCSHGSLN